MCGRSNKILVMGFGSSILTDDGVALKIADHLKKKLPSKLFDFKEDNLISLEVMEELSDYKKIILIDAVANKDAPIGELKSAKLEDFKSSVHLYNIHDLSIHHLSELAKYLNYKISDDIQIITINIKEKEEFSASLSEELTLQFDTICSEIEMFLNKVEDKKLSKKEAI